MSFKTWLVVGSAPCVFEDLKRALSIRPFAELMLVNGACTAVENAGHMLCGHEEKSSFYARERERVFPGVAIRVHACCAPHRKDWYAQHFPDVTDWWPHECGVAATSASKAAKVVMLMGADEVILCGCPMNQPGYFVGEADVPQHVMCNRIGDFGMAFNGQVPVQETRIIKAYRERLKILAETEFKGKVFSMSGFTRDCLGQPREDRV